jgi:Na+-driven multidrug efflux pump
MVAQVVSSILHLLLCLFYVLPYGAGVRGLGIATCITYFAMYIFTEIYALCIPEIKKAMFWPNRDTFNGWHDYLAISLPSTVMLLAEGWAFNVMGVLAGLISVTDQATNTIMLMIIAIMFMVPMGI